MSFHASRPKSQRPTFQWVLRVLIRCFCTGSARKARGIHWRVVRLKRFTETTKWDDPWFMDLPLKYKLFWLYICDKCDNAGAWQPNIRLATAQIGESLELAEVLRVFADRITQLGDGKLFITKFIPFQYGNLSPNCRAHIPILNNIEKLRVSKGYPKGMDTLVEKEKDKDKKGESEGDWIEGLKTDEAYKCIDVPLEHAKALRWAKENKVVMTRRRFVNWLNRADKKLEGGGQRLLPQNLSFSDRKRKAEQIQNQLNAQFKSANQDQHGKAIFTDEEKAERNRLYAELEKYR